VVTGGGAPLVTGRDAVSSHIRWGDHRRAAAEIWTGWTGFGPGVDQTRSNRFSFEIKALDQLDHLGPFLLESYIEKKE
jgi:hypothetical protein